MVNWLIIAVEFLVLGMLYPYCRYAVQRIIDYWHGDERVVYDASIKSSLDRKFAKLMVSLFACWYWVRCVSSCFWLSDGESTEVR